MWNKLFVIIIDLFPCLCLWNYALKRQHWKLNEGKTKKYQQQLARFYRATESIHCGWINLEFYIQNIINYLLVFILLRCSIPYNRYALLLCLGYNFAIPWKENSTSRNMKFRFFCLHYATTIRIYIVIEFQSIYWVTKIA